MIGDYLTHQSIAYYYEATAMTNDGLRVERKDIFVATDSRRFWAADSRLRRAPDTHLDYLSQRKVFEIIKKIAQQDGVNAIVCTHSLKLIDRIPLTDVIHFELEGGTTRINAIEAESPELTELFLYQISDSMGLHNSVMLNERCFLVIEGLTEMGALPVLFRLRFGFSPQAADVRIVNGEGGVGVRFSVHSAQDLANDSSHELPNPLLGFRGAFRFTNLFRRVS